MDSEYYYRKYFDGDDQALAQVICMHKDGLILYLNSYVKDISIAEELTEDTFVKLVLKRPKFHGQASFKTWLYKIGRNIALDYLRRNQKQSIALDDCYDLSDDEQDLERCYMQKENEILLHRAVKKLKPEYQQILWLIYFEEFSNKEAARILGKTTHNVETLVYRARNALKTKLIEEGYVYEKL